jgi:hypothetical protein
MQRDPGDLGDLTIKFMAAASSRTGRAHYLTSIPPSSFLVVFASTCGSQQHLRRARTPRSLLSALTSVKATISLILKSNRLEA